jgi:glycosyltransferase involved in cell wall biosynthesis
VPRVTVIMATYNWAPVLRYSIASVLDQTWRDFELRVVGDGCTDESADVVGAFGDERIHWHNLAVNHGNQSGPNNEGLARARGELIAYLGHDDLWLPHHLATLVGRMDREAVEGNRPGLVCARSLFVDPQTAPRLAPDAQWVYRPGMTIPPTTVVHERDLARQAGGWRPPSTTSAPDPDADLWQRMAADASPQLVDRVTSVKLSAARRRRVYGERPSHEQAWWLERIRAADDPEAEIRSACDHPNPFPATAEEPWQSRRERMGWAARTRWRRLRGRPQVTSAERFALRRRYKGLDPD